MGEIIVVVIAGILIGGMGVLLVWHPNVGKRHDVGSLLAVVRNRLPEPWGRRFMRAFGLFMVMAAALFVLVTLGA